MTNETTKEEIVGENPGSAGSNNDQTSVVADRSTEIGRASCRERV